MKDNMVRNILIIAVILIGISVSIGFSFAYFTANIKGNDTAQPMSVKAGTMELTFNDNPGITLTNAQPGDSKSKIFSITNTGTLEDKYDYNIKLASVITNFKQKDLKYVLEECNDSTCNEDKVDGIKEVGYINEDIVKDGELYLAVKIPRPEKTQTNYYKITLEFQELNINQDYNRNATFSGKINIDDKAGALVYDELQDHPFYTTMMSNPEIIANDDPDKNLRYIGSSEEVNNYIWFNCLKYDDLTKENAEDDQHNCERWRIIGLFRGIQKPDGSTEDLVKIIRADSLGDIAWDTNGINNWATATLQTDLTNYYEGQKLGTSNKGITDKTKNMIEYVIWNIGESNTHQVKAQQFYETERKSTLSNETKATWNGYIGLMYPSDYGYATSGSVNEKTRSQCLAIQLSSYDKNSYCYEKDWLYISGQNQWLLTADSTGSNRGFIVSYLGYITYANANGAQGIHPSLFLKSNVKILNGKGTDTEPYILNQES